MAMPPGMTPAEGPPPPGYIPPTYTPPVYVQSDGTLAGVPAVGSAPPTSGQARGRRGFLGGAAAALVALLKWGIPILKFSKVGVTLISMLVSAAFYAWFFGPAAGVGIVFLIFAHEMGHVLVLRHFGIRASLPMFIPFFGAFIALKQNPQDAWTEALVGIGGPVLGSAGALVCLGLYFQTGLPVLLFLSYFGFLINLFNLVPLSPLDGGRIVSAISVWLNLVGLVVMALAFFLFQSPLMLLILVFGGLNLFSRFRARRQNPGYYEVPGIRRWAMGAAYFGLIACLALAQGWTFMQMPANPLTQ
ncbi:MAG: site-2 protease family protein [Candidatus Dormibacteria bacterium]